MSSKRRLPADNVNSNAKRAVNNNYYQPLQTLNDDEKTDDDMGPSITPKTHIPPITILKTSTDNIHTLCKESRIIKYSIRKISIGYKLFCENQYDYESAVKYLKANKVEYFSYTSKNNRPYKVVLSGLDKLDPVKVKLELIKIGLKCTDVKSVYRKTDNNREIILYIVYLKKGTTSLAELRNNVKSINYIRVKWSYQSKMPNKITQCHNCQMFGHGSNNCNIKTFCAMCAGDHETSKCTSTTVKCANCRGDHKSTDNTCPSRSSYIGLKERYSRPTRQSNPQARANNAQNVNIQSHYPSTSNSFANVVRANNTTQNITTSNNATPNNASNDLFSLEELKTLTFELIENLKNCKTKSDQFNVITNLAFKFLP